MNATCFVFHGQLIYLFWVVVLFCTSSKTAPVFAQSAGSTSGSVVYRQEWGSGVDKQAVLVFRPGESLYYFQRKDRKKASLDPILVDEAGNSAEYSIDVADREGMSYYMNTSRQQLVSRTFDFFSNDYLIIEEPIPALAWVIGTQIRTIGKYEAQQATCTFRGRNWTVWFTPEIPVGLGPWKLQGLPGLILEARDSENKYVCEMISIDMPAKINTPVLPPQKGKVVGNWMAYEKAIRASADKWAKSMTSRGPGMSAKPILDEGIEKITEL